MVTADHGRPLMVRLLGLVRAWRGDRELELGGPQRQAVLGLLALRANQAVSRSELIDGIWGEDPPPSAVNALHVHVAGLRRALEPNRAPRAPGQFLLAAGPGYSLRLEPGQLDAQVLARHLDTARAARAAGDLSGAARSFDTALRLWRAAPLSGVPGPWAEIERVRLSELRLAAIEERAEIMLMLGRAATAAAELTGLVREHPLREGLRGQLMLALYRCGRQADALATFTGGRRILIEELGLEPCPGLRRLHEQILAADPALGPPAAAVPLAGPEHVWAAPAQLPGDVDAFTGRAGELAAFDKLAAVIGPAGGAGQPGTGPAATVICVSGTAGAGKTALAVHWARRVRAAFPDGQLYVNLRGYDPGQPVPAGDALAGFLRALGVPGQDIPREVDERAAAYRTLLDGRRILVVLDNASAVEQVRPLLPGSPSSLALVTSRDSLAGLVARHGARRLDLDPLPQQDAVALLRALIGDRAEIQPDATAMLARQCARLPLALRVAAELAAASPAMTVAQLAGALADEQRRLDLLDAGGDPGSAIRGVFSWSYDHLPDEPARAFRLLGLSPGPDIDACAAAALTGAPPEQASRMLGLLARTHLIHRTRPGRYGLHDLLRAYAAGLAAAGDAEGERHAALTRLFDYYLAAAAAAMDTLVPAERHLRPRVHGAGVPAPPLAGPVTPAAARGWLDTERAVLVAVSTHAAAHGWPAHTTGLAGTLYRYLETGGHYPDAIAVHSAALQAARRTGDRAAEATALTNLGIVDWRQGRYRQAAGHHRRALRVSREIGDRSGEATALNNVGIIYERQGEAAALAGLGIVDGRQGRYERAAENYRQAISLAVQIGDRPGEVEAHNGAGAVLLAVGQPGQARVQHHVALALASQIGDRYEQARAHDGLARTYRATAGHGQARRHFEHALALFTVLGAPETDDVQAQLTALGSAGPGARGRLAAR
jgi:DNA-binding SARP family transcriptional activator/Tfp pilus assembly protein PilF